MFSDSSIVVTRFAPSPTGKLHVGGARTALFAWAFARQHGGRFILRQEDTDRARSTVTNARHIIASLRWMGLDWDEGPLIPEHWTQALEDGYDPHATCIGDHGPYFQSQRLELYRHHIQRLMDAGHAYKCFKTPQQLEADRQQAAQDGRPYKYDRSGAMGLSPQQIQAHEREGRPYVVRFRMPDHDIVIDDEVRGTITLASAEREDFVIQKADGFPTFHLAVTLDDALMGVTHVIRAQDHLTNTPKHWALQDALGFEHPTYAHLSLIFNANGSKMSKREKAKAAREAARAWISKGQSVPAIVDLCMAAQRQEHSPANRQRIAEFIEKKNDDVQIAELLGDALDVSLPEIDIDDFMRHGYLPDALCNYMALLGWSPGDDIEKFDRTFLIENLRLDRIVKANARFDRAKLLSFNADAIAAMPFDAFCQHLYERNPQLRRLGEADDWRFESFARAYQPRSHTLCEPAQLGRFFLVDDDQVEYDAKALEKVLKKNDGAGLKLLGALGVVLARCQPWDEPTVQEDLEAYALEHQLSMGQVAQPLRVAVSGGTVSPPIALTLIILGRSSTLARLDRCRHVSGSTAPEAQ